MNQWLPYVATTVCVLIVVWAVQPLCRSLYKRRLVRESVIQAEIRENDEFWDRVRTMPESKPEPVKAIRHKSPPVPPLVLRPMDSSRPYVVHLLTPDYNVDDFVAVLRSLWLPDIGPGDPLARINHYQGRPIVDARLPE